MTSETRLQIRVSKARVARLFTWIVILLHLANIFAVLFRYVLGDFWMRDTYITLLSVSSEGKIPTWYSACALLLCSVLLTVVSLARRLERDPHLLGWIGLAVVFALMSLDEATEIHEMTNTYLEAFFPAVYSPWWIVGLVFVAVLGILYCRFLITLPKRTRRFFLIAGGVYLSGVLALEIVGTTYLGSHGRTLTYGIIATIEEVLEMSGVVVFIYALIDYLEKHTPSMRITFAP